MRLYTADGVLPDVVGVLVRPAAKDHAIAFVAPWPDAVTATTPFGLVVVSDDGAAHTWRRPKAVTVLRLKGGGAASSDTISSAAAIYFADPGLVLPSASSSEVAMRLQERNDIADAVAAFAPMQLAPLITATQAPAISIDATALQQLATVTASSEIGDAIETAQGICRIFRWDT